MSRRRLVTLLAVSALLAGVSGGAVAASEAPPERPDTRSVMFVGNNWEGTATVVDSHTFEVLTEIDVIPDRDERMAEITSSPDRLAFFLAIREFVGDTLVLRGRHLRGDTVRVRVGDAVGVPTVVQPRRLEVPLTGAGFPEQPLKAGVQGVRVLHFRELGDPPAPHVGPSSNVQPLVLRPRVTAVSLADDTITVTVEPALGQGQRGELLLAQVDAAPGETPRGYSLPLPAVEADAASVDVAGAQVAPGSYVARVRVDGAESLVELDGDGDPVEDQLLEVP